MAEAKTDVHKILLRSPNWIGDAVLSVPAIRAIRQSFRESDITLLARPWVSGLFTCSPFVDHIWTDPWPSGPSAWYKTVRAIRRGRFDIAVLFPNSFISAAMVFLAGVPRRVGYARDGRGWLLTDHVTPPRKRHQLYYYMEIAASISTDIEEPKLGLRPSEYGLDKARDLLASEGIPKERRYMVLCPGAAFGSAKRWGANRFAECAEQLGGEFDFDVAIVGSREELPIAEEVRSRMNRSVAILNGKTSLDILMGVLKQASLVITNDSGPMHIAAGLATPTVAVFGSTDQSVTGPWGPRTRIVREPVDCSPCLLRECPIDHRCMTRITADAVCRAAREMVSA